MIMLDNLTKIREEVRQYDREITLIAATKTQTKQTVDEFAALAPEFIVGENRVQEFVEKYDERYTWHIIGQLQTNKVKYVVGKAELIHSLDREDLAREIEKQAAKRNVIQRCLVEVNMGAEIAKGGVAPSETLDFIRSTVKYPHIKIEGIMSVLPNLGDVKELHDMYDRLFELFENAKKTVQDNVEIKYLSAGMTNDYKIALEHGANMIRLGRVLFGERTYVNNIN